MTIQAHGKKGVSLPYLRAWRVYRLMSNGELAQRAGISAAAISKIEAGSNATFATIGKLAAALGISREDLTRKDPDAHAA